ncbi:hypothetical protein D0Y65_030953 [Glycine soja]|uniref:Uncharacterized protein n=1 Tax=Glycine soja TaxID=3848 RepID=A0A445I621_GLYSO|nr:hypothetical protein D0Y65_030953 [Glycine soja]
MAQQSSPPRRQTPPPSQYLEVNCRSSGKIRRFAAGTGAGFAVALINRKLKGTVVAASHIEAVKDGKEEEPIAFGPTSLLSNFGEGWKLQTVTLTDLSSEVGNGQFQQMAMQKPGLVSLFSFPLLHTCHFLKLTFKFTIHHLYFSSLRIGSIGKL